MITELRNIITELCNIITELRNNITKLHNNILLRRCYDGGYACVTHVLRRCYGVTELTQVLRRLRRCPYRRIILTYKIRRRVMKRNILIA